MESLGQDDAVEKIRGDVIGVRQVCDDSRHRVAWCNVQDVFFQDTIPAKPAHVTVIPHFQHTSVDVIGMTPKKGFDVIPINGNTAIKPKFVAQRCEPPQIAKTDLAFWWNIGAILPPDQQTAKGRGQDFARPSYYQPNQMPKRVPGK